jgi:hypothetical protein
MNDEVTYPMPSDENTIATRYPEHDLASCAQQAAYRRLALVILGLDVATLAGELRPPRRSIIPRAA